MWENEEYNNGIRPKSWPQMWGLGSFFSKGEGINLRRGLDPQLWGKLDLKFAQISLLLMHMV